MTRVTDSNHPGPGYQAGRLDRWAATLLQRQLSKLQEGEILLVEGEQQATFGHKTDRFPVSVRIDIHAPSFYGETLFGGSVGSAESYMAGSWSCSSLTDLVRIMVRNRSVMEGLDGGYAWITVPLRKALHALNRNTESGSRRNIAAHYDIGNDFFQLFLDETMMYSCGWFERPETTLAEASRAKLDLICRKLDLQPDDRVVEIGTGWGGFALHAARHFGCHVTTTTISEQQYQWANERVREAGLEERITLLKRDYRQLEGQFDKLVSIEMIEAVGHHYFETFFRQCGQLLKPDGLMLLQAITINDRHYRQARDEVDFIKRYIFPGSCIPAVGPLLEAATRASDLQLIQLNDIGPHYATTLRAWREALLAHREAVRNLGHTDEFIRLWEFYFSYCEGGFAERALGDVHMLMAKPLYRGPMKAG